MVTTTSIRIRDEDTSLENSLKPRSHSLYDLLYKYLYYKPFFTGLYMYVNFKLYWDRFARCTHYNNERNLELLSYDEQSIRQ